MAAAQKKTSKAKKKTSVAKRKASPKRASKEKAATKKPSVKRAVKKATKKTVKKKAVKKTAKKTAVKKSVKKTVKKVARKPLPKKSKRKTPPKSKLTPTGVVNVAQKAKRKRQKKRSGVDAFERRMFLELEILASYIEKAKSEIAALRPDEVRDDLLPSASDELDAITAAAADATHNIMDATETIEGVMGKVDGPHADALMDATTRIYEACSFQDITGQRVGKVVKALKHIEVKIDALVHAFGKEIARHKAESEKSAKPAEKKPLTDEDLLEGPQLLKDAKSQQEIDDLLNSFD